MQSLITVAVIITIIMVLFILIMTVVGKENFASGCNRINVYELKYGDGPIIGLIGGVHGNEPAGAVAYSQLVRGEWVLPPDLQRGTFIIIPRANFCGLIKNTRYMSTMANKDLNRNFSEDGPLDAASQQVLDAFSRCDFIIDIHEGYAFHKTTPQSVGSTLAATSPLSEAIAQSATDAINMHIVEDYKKFTNLHYEDCDIKNTLSCYMRNRGRDYILIEISGQNNLQPMDLRVWQAKFLTEHILRSYFGSKTLP